MTIPSPFSSPLPLSTVPFKSRVEDNIFNDKNYFAVAFKPGFPLQAAELNEIQEIFYTQQTLSNKLQSTGWTGAVPWNGATPLEKGSITFGLTGPIKFGVGWYLVQNQSFNGGLGVWAYNPTIKGVTTSHVENNPAAFDTKYGFIVKITTVECAASGSSTDTEDATLRDQSNFNIINGPCGAARLRLDFIRAGATAGVNETFVPVFKGPQSTVSGTSVIARVIKFENGDEKRAGT